MKKIVLLFYYLIIALVVSAQKTYIWCGTLIDGVSDGPKKNMSIVVEKHKILSVENGFSKAGGTDKAIDLKTKTVTPGWMYMHVHLEGETSPTQYMERFTLNPPDLAFNSVPIAE